MSPLSRRRRVRPVAIDPATGNVVSPWPFAGVCLMAAAFFLYAASGLLVPWWIWAVLMFAWLILLPQTLRGWDTEPKRPFRVAVVVLAAWAVVAVGGGLVFGWDPWWG